MSDSNSDSDSDEDEGEDKDENNNNDDSDDEEEGNEGGVGSEDDDEDMGILNISNQDINDFDVVLQGGEGDGRVGGDRMGREARVLFNSPMSRRASPSNAKKDSKSSIHKSGTPMTSPIGSHLVNHFHSNLNSPLYTPNKSIYTPHSQMKNTSEKNKKIKLKSPVPRRNGMEGVAEKNDKYENTNDKNQGNERNEGNMRVLGRKVDNRFLESVAAADMSDMTSQIRLLQGELKYYEQLTGKRGIFETQVLLRSKQNANISF